MWSILKHPSSCRPPSAQDAERRITSHKASSCTPCTNRSAHCHPRTAAPATRKRTCAASSDSNDFLISRRDAVLGTASLLAANSCDLSKPRSAHALPTGSVDARLAEAFNAALSAGGDPEASEKAWTRAIGISPTNAAAWSNRATSRLQRGRWADARDDFLRAVELEVEQTGSPSAISLNNLGNCKGALGDWDGAMRDFKKAAEDPELQAIALANLALANFQVQSDKEAIRIARQLLRSDPEFLDMKAALTAFLWGSGQQAAAEGEWEDLRSAQSGIGGYLYSRSTAVDRVRGRWPPRATAALDAFVKLSRTGVAMGYESQLLAFDFGTETSPDPAGA